MRTAVLILNYNGASWLPQVYDTLARQGADNLRTYLVDNASADDSVALTLGAHPEVKVIQLSRNVGYSMAYNAASPVAFADGCDLVVWANNDIKLEADCIRNMEEAFGRDETIGIVGPAFLDWSSDVANRYMAEVHPDVVAPMMEGREKPVPVDWVEGSFLMISKSCFEDVGPLDPDFFFYWEEANYCRRARYQGWRVVIAPTAVARHYGGGSSGTPSRRDMLRRLKTRNEYIYRATDPTRSWPANLVTLAHIAAVKLKAGMLSRDTTVIFELTALSDAARHLGMMRRKWRRDRSRTAPEPWTKAEASTRCTVVSHGAFAK